MHTCVLLLIYVLQENSTLCNCYVITQRDIFFAYDVYILTTQIKGLWIMTEKSLICLNWVRVNIVRLKKDDACLNLFM